MQILGYPIKWVTTLHVVAWNPSSLGSEEAESRGQVSYRAGCLDFQSRRSIITTLNSAAITKAITDNVGMSGCAWVPIKPCAEAS